MIIAVVVILVLIVFGLIIYNINIHNKIQKFKNMNQKITNLYVVQDFINAIGETSTVETKINKINDILIERYEIKYSTIVVFDGVKYNIKASNVDKKHWKTLSSLSENEMFKDSIGAATPKYITVNKPDEKLTYQEMEFGRAKSAIFFPLYVENVYIGYWIIESEKAHDFDNVDTTVLEVIKDNIVTVLKTVVHQKVLESIVRKDEFTGLYSEEYLYGEAKKQIDQYTKSSVCMFKITNIQKINKQYSRELGNKVITEISNYIKSNIAEEYVFVRYMGPKFVIVFSGVELNAAADFLNDLKDKIEELLIALTEEEVKELDMKRENSSKELTEGVKPKLNFVLTTYYKGTGIEEVLKKSEEYLDHADVNESDITSI